ncbi:hypothetical protein GCM10010228_39420 [Streptomyces massasporeus]|nr:hypothetical protein GCM10010228_39420 [Streptomyces massasporeus]
MAVVARPIADPTSRAISTRLSLIESSSSWYASRIRLSLSCVCVGGSSGRGPPNKPGPTEQPAVRPSYYQRSEPHAPTFRPVRVRFRHPK